MAKFKLTHLEKTVQIEVEIKPLITDVMKSQGWWRVSTALPFPSEHWRLTRDHETSALATKALLLLWAAFLQQCSQPQLLPVRALAAGTKCLWSRQPTRWPPTAALVPSTPSFPTPPTQGCDSPHFLTSLIVQPFKLLKLAVQNPLQSLDCLTLSPSYLLFFSCYHTALFRRGYLNNYFSDPNGEWKSSQSWLIEIGKGIPFPSGMGEGKLGWLRLVFSLFLYQTQFGWVPKKSTIEMVSFCCCLLTWLMVDQAMKHSREANSLDRRDWNEG